MPDNVEIEFRWKELVIYWDGPRGAVFPAAWGGPRFVTFVPDATSWDRRVPPWLHGRHDEIVERLRALPTTRGHDVIEEADDEGGAWTVEEISREHTAPHT